MATPVQPSRAAAVLFLHELDRVAAAATASGKTPPPVSKWADGMSQRDARAWLQWGIKQPEIAAALNDRRHPDHAMAADLRAVVEHFAYAHPAIDPDTPAPWVGEPLSPALAGWALGTRDTFDLAELTPREAADLAGFAEARSDLQAAISRNDPAAEAVLAALDAVGARAGQATDAPPAVERMPEAADSAAASPAPAEIARLLSDTEFRAAYLDGHHPGHAAAVAKMQAAHEALIPKPDGGATPAPATPVMAAAPADPRAAIKAKQADKDFMGAYLSRQHPGHGAAIETMRELHEAAAAAPAAATESDQAA